MKKDRLSTVALGVAEFLPDEPWRDGEAVYCMSIPLAVETDNDRKSVPYIRINLNKEQYEYIAKEAK